MCHVGVPLIHVWIVSGQVVRGTHGCDLPFAEGGSSVCVWGESVYFVGLTSTSKLKESINQGVSCLFLVLLPFPGQ